ATIKLISPAAGDNPLLHLRNTIPSPEMLAVHDKERRTKYPPVDRRIRDRLKTLLEFRVFQRIAKPCRLYSKFRAQRTDYAWDPKILLFKIIRLERPFGEPNGEVLILRLNPIERPAGRESHYRMERRKPEVDVLFTSYPCPVPACVVPLQ